MAVFLLTLKLIIMDEIQLQAIFNCICLKEYEDLAFLLKMLTPAELIVAKCVIKNIVLISTFANTVEDVITLTVDQKVTISELVEGRIQIIMNQLNFY
jgi:hypothetical protein